VAIIEAGLSFCELIKVLSPPQCSIGHWHLPGCGKFRHEISAVFYYYCKNYIILLNILPEMLGILQMLLGLVNPLFAALFNSDQWRL